MATNGKTGDHQSVEVYVPGSSVGVNSGNTLRQFNHGIGQEGRLFTNEAVTEEERLIAAGDPCQG